MSMLIWEQNILDGDKYGECILLVSKKFISPPARSTSYAINKAKRLSYASEWNGQIFCSLNCSHTNVISGYLSAPSICQIN